MPAPPVATLLPHPNRFYHSPVSSHHVHMNPTELRTTLRALGWSMTFAARALGIPYRTLQAAADDGPHGRVLHPSAARLLHLAATHPRVRAELERMAGG